MNIRILQLIEGAKQATGIAVIIDVFRAFSVEAYLTAKGAGKIIPVGDMQIAYDMKKENPDVILIGERGSKKLPGFDYGNSPSEIENVDFVGKTVVHTTSSGTQGIANAKNAEVIVTGSLVNAKAIAEYIKREGFEDISLVGMGLGGKMPSDEDTLCAEYIKSLLLNEPFDLEGGIEALKKTTGARFFDPEQDHSPEKDFYMCTDANKFGFVLKVERDPETGLERSKRIDIYG